MQVDRAPGLSLDTRRGPAYQNMPSTLSQTQVTCLETTSSPFGHLSINRCVQVRGLRHASMQTTLWRHRCPQARMDALAAPPYWVAWTAGSRTPGGGGNVSDLAEPSAAHPPRRPPGRAGGDRIDRQIGKCKVPAAPAPHLAPRAALASPPAPSGLAPRSGPQGCPCPVAAPPAPAKPCAPARGSGRARTPRPPPPTPPPAGGRAGTVTRAH